MLLKRFLIKTFLPFLFIFIGFQSFAQADASAGKEIFKAKCGACHAKDMKTDLTGPALGGVEGRWEEQADLYSWIRQSQKLVASGNARAKELFAEWKVPMADFPNLTDDEIGNILVYIDQEYTKVPKVVAEDATGANGSEDSNKSFYFMIFGILAVLALVLAYTISNLNHSAQVKEGTAPAFRKSFLEELISPAIVGFVLFALILIGGYITVNNAMDLGRQKGYQPEQPIKFSHATHAGEQQIDCQYCHDGARRSRHSVVPATNTCMNCHAAIKEGSKYGTAEISKIHASAGWNPNTGKYFAENTSDKEIETAFRKWIGDRFKAGKGKDLKEDEITAEVDAQWAITSKQVNRPIEWTKVHNLPDHVYYNHSQHVNVGKLECQTCHGKVEEMEVVEQFSPLSMGWCVNCHRQADVQFADNPYYDSYEAYHNELKNGDRESVTVEDIGGLECQKCHY